MADNGELAARFRLANLRQELLTPVNAVLDYGEMLREEAVARGIDAVVSDLERIVSTARELLALVDSSLEEEHARALFEGAGTAAAQRALRHDLRNPINVVKGYGEIVLEELADEAEFLREDLTRLLVEADRFLSQIDAIIDFAYGAVDSLPPPREAPAKVIAAGVASEQPKPETGHVLLVDDNETFRELLTRRLGRAGHQVTVAAAGAEALALAARMPFDLVILDVMMPDTDGFTVCRALKADERTQLVPIIIMSALDSVEDRINGIEAGADDFISKPADIRELLARIQTVLKLKRKVDRKIDELHHIKDHFANFVPEAVKRLVASNPEAPELAKREYDVSVLFVDISGYTALSERLDPAELNGLVERYFSAFLDQVQEAGGDINETAGDGFMTIFHEQDPTEHAARAVDTALGLLAITDALNRSHGRQSLDIHMGVNSGVALVGSTRFEGARGTRWTFTASGPVTNLAARLAASAAAHEILAGPETARRLRGRYRLADLGPRQLRNVGGMVHLYRVLDPISVAR